MPRLRRVISIVSAFISASILTAPASALTYALLTRPSELISDIRSASLLAVETWDAFLTAVLVVALLQFLPALIWISWAETSSFRNPLFYIGASILSPLAASIFLPSVFGVLAANAGLAVIGGVVFGLVYWLIAGRSAGLTFIEQSSEARS